MHVIFKRQTFNIHGMKINHYEPSKHDRCYVCGLCKSRAAITLHNQTTVILYGLNDYILFIKCQKIIHNLLILPNASFSILKFPCQKYYCESYHLALTIFTIYNGHVYVMQVIM